MRVDIKTFPICVPVRETTYQYTSKFNDAMLSKIKNIYDGRCFRGFKILKVISIATDVHGIPIITMPEFDNMRRDNTAIANVMINAEVLNIKQFDIIHLTKVVSITPQHILCNWEHGSAMIKNNKLLQTIKVGQTIPVRVGDQRFTYTKKMISVSAIPFIPVQPMQPTFIVVEKPSVDDIKYITKLYDDGLMFYNKVKTHALFSKFSEMLTITSWVQKTIKRNDTVESSNKEAKLELNEQPILEANKTQQSIADIISAGKPFIGTRVGVTNPNEPIVALVSDVNVVGVNVKWVAAVSILIDDWIEFVNNCYELSLVYNVDDLYEKSKNIWVIYQNVKAEFQNP